MQVDQDEKPWFAPSSAQELDSYLRKLFANVTRTQEQERAAVYSRVSSINPDERSYSIEYQPDKAEEYAVSRKWEIAGIYSDPDRSGKNSRRPGLQAMIRDIRSGKVTVVVVHRLDRIYRNLESLLRFMNLLKRYQVRLVSITEQINHETWWGKLMTYILGALAEMYIVQTSIRIKEIKAEMVRRGLHNGQPPFGYCNGLCSTCEDLNGPGYCPLVGGLDRPESKRGRVPVHHPIDQYAARLIHKLYNQRYSYKDIADYLNTHTFTLPGGLEVIFRTKGRNNQKPGRPFNSDSIRDIINNPFYAGLVVRRNTRPLDMDDIYLPDHHLFGQKPARREKFSPEGAKRQIIEMQRGQHEALIPVQLWEENKQIRAGKKNAPVNANRTVREYLLSGIGYCWECRSWDGRKAALRGITASSKRVPYYRCVTMQEEYKLRSKQPVSAETLETVNVRSTERPDNQALIHRHRSLRSEVMEEQVNQLMEHMVIPESWYETFMAYYLHEDGMSVFELQTYNLRRELERKEALFFENRISRADMEDIYMHIQSQLQKRKPSANPKAQGIIPLLKDFPGLWRQMVISERQALLKVIFTGLYFDANGKLVKAVARSPFDKILPLNQDGSVRLPAK